MVRDEDIRVRLTASTDEDQPVQTEDIYDNSKKQLLNYFKIIIFYGFSL